jgi:hypothetical protein
MFEAAVSGARTDEVEGIEVVIRPALTAAAADVLQADGYLLGTPANIGYMSGALKHFFNGIYYPCLEATRRRPYGLYVHGGMDTGGAVRAVESITTGLQWRAVRVTGPGHHHRPDLPRTAQRHRPDCSAALRSATGCRSWTSCPGSRARKSSAGWLGRFHDRHGHRLDDALIHVDILPHLNRGIPAAHAWLRRQGAEVRGSPARHPGSLPAQSRRAPPRCSWPHSHQRYRRIRRPCTRTALGSYASPHPHARTPSTAGS